MNPYIKELIQEFIQELNEQNPQPEDATHFTFQKIVYNSVYSNVTVRWVTWYKVDLDGNIWEWDIYFKELEDGSIGRWRKRYNTLEEINKLTTLCKLL